MPPSREFIVERQEQRIFLRAPEVGTFTCVVEEGAVLTPGSRAGVLHRLDVAFELIVPAGVTGRIVSIPPERVHAPVEYGAVLYELAPLATTVIDSQQKESAVKTRSALALRAPYSGRFWHRPAPEDPAYVQIGDVLEPGRTVGLIEVMKTFTHLSYEARGALPQKARIVKLLADDGDEVDEGDPLIEVESV
jgi:biotin carboxyl carrier protein